MSDIDPVLLKRYAEGKCTAEERLSVEAWLDNDDSLIAQQAGLQVIKPGNPDDNLKNEIWNEIVYQSGKTFQKKTFFALQIC